MARKAKETTKESAAKTKETAVKAKEAVVETAAKAKEAVAETAAKAKETVAETAAKAKEATAKAKETVAAKSAAKKSSKDSCFVEFSNKQFSTEEIVENAKLNWKASHDGSISEIKVYVNVDESKVYYVVNGADAGDFQI